MTLVVIPSIMVDMARREEGGGLPEPIGYPQSLNDRRRHCQLSSANASERRAHRQHRYHEQNKKFRSSTRFIDLICLPIY